MPDKLVLRRDRASGALLMAIELDDAPARPAMFGRLPTPNAHSDDPPFGRWLEDNDDAVYWLREQLGCYARDVLDDDDGERVRMRELLLDLEAHAYETRARR